MSENAKEIFVGTAVAVAFVGLMTVVGWAGKNNGYDQGQRDALDGKQKYTKVKDADGHEYVVEKR